MNDGQESLVPETWCVIEAGEFVKLLKRAHQGEDPDMLMMEFLANSDSETVEGE